MSIASGINFHGFGNFIIPLGEEFGWSRTTISVVFSVARLESGLLGPAEGWAVDRVGPRRLIAVGIPLMGLGYVAMSRIDGLLTFFFVYVFMIALGNSLGMSTPITAAVANWFNRKRGLAFGIMWSGVGIGGLFVPALGWLVETYGWRPAALMVGVFIAVLGVPVATVMRHRPEPYGYYPDGIVPDEVRASGAARRPLMPDLSDDFTAREALRTSSFWFLTLSIMAPLSRQRGHRTSPRAVLHRSGSVERDRSRSCGVGRTYEHSWQVRPERSWRLRQQTLRDGRVARSDGGVHCVHGEGAQRDRCYPYSRRVFGLAGRYFRDTAVADRRLLWTSFLRNDPGIQVNHSDARNHRRTHHQRVRVRHDRKLHHRLSGIFRGLVSLHDPGVHGEATGEDEVSCEGQGIEPEFELYPPLLVLPIQVQISAERPTS